MNFHLWLTFAVAYLVTTLSPGPNVLLVVRNSLKYGASSALVTIMGNLTSQLVIVLLVACGVGAAIAALPQFFVVMKIIGALYLFLLGIKQIRSARSASVLSHEASSEADSNQDSMSRLKVFREAFLVSSSNPKTLIFLSAFMPQFVSQNASLFGQFSVMYLTIAMIVVCVHFFYSVSVHQFKNKIKNSRVVTSIKYVGGSIFLLLGLKLLVSERA